MTSDVLMDVITRDVLIDVMMRDVMTMDVMTDVMMRDVMLKAVIMRGVTNVFTSCSSRETPQLWLGETVSTSDVTQL